MDPRVEKFLNDKREEIKKKELMERQQNLIEAGLYEKEYSKNDQYSLEYPYSEDNSLGQTKYYKLVAINITDEEYEEVKKYVTCNKKVEKNSAIAVLLAIIGILLYVCGFIAGIVLGDEYGVYSFEFSVAFITWISSFIVGTVFLGFGKIISLLEEINNK